MDLYEKYDELIGEMSWLKNMQKEINHKQKILQQRLLNPTLSVFKAHSAFVFTENQIDIMIKKHEWFMKFLNNLPEKEYLVLNGFISRVNIFHLAESLGITTDIAYQRLYSAIKKYREYKADSKQQVIKDEN